VPSGALKIFPLTSRVFVGMHILWHNCTGSHIFLERFSHYLRSAARIVRVPLILGALLPMPRCVAAEIQG
jgi:hypothetical protein